jgi:hypothetical protein
MTTTMMRLWMRAATEDERLYLALEAGTSRGYLDQLSGGHRNTSPETAAAIERVTAEMHAETHGRLPRLYRTDLVPACHGCQFAAQCLGADVLMRADFPVVTAGEVAVVALAPRTERALTRAVKTATKRKTKKAAVKTATKRKTKKAA